MIYLTRLNGDRLYVNADLIERIEATSDTVITLVDGKKLVAQEPPEVLIERMLDIRARVIVAAELMQLEVGPHSSTQRRSASAPTPLRLIEETPKD